MIKKKESLLSCLYFSFVIFFTQLLISPYPLTQPYRVCSSTLFPCLKHSAQLWFHFRITWVDGVNLYAQVPTQTNYVRIPRSGPKALAVFNSPGNSNLQSRLRLCSKVFLCTYHPYFTTHFFVASLLTHPARHSSVILSSCEAFPELSQPRLA